LGREKRYKRVPNSSTGITFSPFLFFFGGHANLSLGENEKEKEVGRWGVSKVVRHERRYARLPRRKAENWKARLGVRKGERASVGLMKVTNDSQDNLIRSVLKHPLYFNLRNEEKGDGKRVKAFPSPSIFHPSAFLLTSYKHVLLFCSLLIIIPPFLPKYFLLLLFHTPPIPIPISNIKNAPQR